MRVLKFVLMGLLLLSVVSHSIVIKLYMDMMMIFHLKMKAYLHFS
eukprot:UN24909